MENCYLAVASGPFGTDLPITPQEDFVTGVYSAMDEATADRMDRLRSEEGIVPACTRGCCHCCRYHIVTSIAEAHTLAQYVKRELSLDQIDDLRLRTQQWHAWDHSQPGRHPSAPIVAPVDLSHYEPCCPLLVEGVCSVYPVRPVVCRTHFVCSHPVFCYAANDPNWTQDVPTVLTSVVTVADPFARTIRDHIEDAGVDSSRSMMLLPHGLALHMGWDFALTP